MVSFNGLVWSVNNNASLNIPLPIPEGIDDYDLMLISKPYKPSLICQY